RRRGRLADARQGCRRRTLGRRNRREACRVIACVCRGRPQADPRRGAVAVASYGATRHDRAQNDPYSISGAPMAVPVKLKRLAHGADLPLPAYQTEEAAGLDLLAAVDTAVVLQPGERALVPTGIAVALPPHTEAQVRPRSGLAVKHGITVLNAPGTIDADYRGEIKVPLINLGQEPYRIERGSRIAQMVVAPVTRAALIEVP